MLFTTPGKRTNKPRKIQEIQLPIYKGVLKTRRRARILGQIFGVRPDGRGLGGQGGYTVLQFYWGVERQVYSSTPGSMNSLFGDFFRDFWPGFLALEKTAGGGGGGGKNIKNTVLSLDNSNLSSGKYHSLFTSYFLVNLRTYFRYYIILFKILLNSLFKD